jgi:uncharacterized membrane protein YGL010W
MNRIDPLFDRYAESHRDPTNKTIHWICVPLILWSGLAALWAWTPVAAGVAAALAMAYYVWMSPRLALGMLAVIAVMLAALPLAPSRGVLLTAAVAVFVAAWVGQFIGHRIEGRKPSFFDDLTFLLIGPAWLLAFVYRRLRLAY